LIENKSIIDFPTNEQMVYDTGEDLKLKEKKKHLIVIPYKYVVETSNKQNAFPGKAFCLFIK